MLKATLMHSWDQITVEECLAMMNIFENEKQCIET